MRGSHQPVVSIVIPCYNQGRFLPEAIGSALQQTHPFVEVTVVDDGSTDDTASVIEDYPTIRRVAQPNRGVTSARNAGLFESRGEYVVFLDADDILLPHAVTAGVECLDAHPDWAFVTGHVALMNQDGSPAGVPVQEHDTTDPYLELLRANYIWTPGAAMYRRTVFGTTGGFDARAGPSADYELNIRIARRFPFGCHHQVILQHRRHDANMSADVARMLQSAVSVRRSQRKHVRADAAAMGAWKQGLELAKADYGGRLAAQVTDDLRSARRWRRAVDGLLCLLRYYPAGVLAIVRSGTSRLLSGRHRQDTGLRA
jgi:glycosyltransferase involved in cell wall biosynthesis